MEQSQVYKSEAVKAMQAQLKNPINPKFVKCRVGARSKDKTKGIALFYLDAREVEKVLDNILGPENWATNLNPIVSPQGFHGFTCSLTVYMPDGKTVTKTDAGEASKTSPVKGAASDALKRAAVLFGVGRYLYYIPNQWYKLNEFGNFIEEPQLPKWALPDENLSDWEEIAIKEYDPSKDVDLDFLADADFVDEESKKILKDAQARRKEIINTLKAKKNVG